MCRKRCSCTYTLMGPEEVCFIFCEMETMLYTAMTKLMDCVFLLLNLSPSLYIHIDIISAVVYSVIVIVNREGCVPETNS